jgi:hypothetical protein
VAIYAAALPAFLAHLGSQRGTQLFPLCGALGSACGVSAANQGRWPLADLGRAAGGVPLNDVKQTGQKVEFGLKVAHGSFEGTLNKDGTELAGELTHEGGSTPLTLRKK